MKKIGTKLQYHFDMYLYSKNINKMEANLNPKDVTFSLQVSPKKKYQKMGLHDQLTMCLISKTYTMFKKRRSKACTCLTGGLELHILCLIVHRTLRKINCV